MYRSLAIPFLCLTSVLFSRHNIVSANYVCNRDFQYNVTGPVRDIYCSADTSEPSQLEQFQVHLHTGSGMGGDGFPAPYSVYKSEPVDDDDDGLYYYIALNNPFRFTLFVLSLAVEVVMILRSCLYFIFRHNTNTLA